MVDAREVLHRGHHRDLILAHKVKTRLLAASKAARYFLAGALAFFEAGEVLPCPYVCVEGIVFEFEAVHDVSCGLVMQQLVVVIPRQYAAVSGIKLKRLQDRLRLPL